jgi:hypothetical protein
LMEEAVSCSNQFKVFLISSKESGSTCKYLAESRIILSSF